ncbi:MAG: nucleotide exchange factor GrpE [Rhodobacterales bacterium]|nr:nucleotide exchange factor GrpE [Rhodobacterales bacterium]
MTDTKPDPKPETETPTEPAAEPEAPEDMAQGDMAPDDAAQVDLEIPEPPQAHREEGEGASDEGAAAARVAELLVEVDTLKDRLLRQVAETENLRRRAQREKEDASKYAIANFAREMVGVADNLRRALDSVDGETRSADASLDSLATGVEMTERAMLAAFDKVGITRIEAEGKLFDHNLHEAMFEVPNPEVPAGTVVTVMETGYVLADRLLRPARVGVARGGPKPEPRAEAEPAPDAKASTAYEGDPSAKGANLDEEL